MILTSIVVFSNLLDSFSFELFSVIRSVFKIDFGLVTFLLPYVLIFLLKYGNDTIRGDIVLEIEDVLKLIANDRSMDLKDEKLFAEVNVM